MKKIGYLILMAVFLGAFSPAFSGDAANKGVPEVPVPGQVTLVDLGAHKCIPCKMMAPILAELETEYQGRAAIVFIDVWQNPSEAKRFGIRAIPTQIFFDASGREVSRHVGYLDKKSIVAILKNLGVEPGAAPSAE